MRSLIQSRISPNSGTIDIRGWITLCWWDGRWEEVWGRAEQAEPAGRGPALFLVRLLAASLVSTQTMLVAHPPR